MTASVKTQNTTTNEHLQAVAPPGHETLVPQTARRTAPIYASIRCPHTRSSFCIIQEPAQTPLSPSKISHRGKQSSSSSSHGRVLL